MKSAETVIVGYVANGYGRDALNTAISLVRGREANIELVTVDKTPRLIRGKHPHTQGFQSILEEQFQAWLDEALTSVPDDVVAHGRYVRARDVAEALSNAAEVLEADLIVIGGREAKPLSRAFNDVPGMDLINMEMHPVVLAPQGFSYTGPLKRLTCIVGHTSDAARLVKVMRGRAKKLDLPLRLISVGKAEMDGCVVINSFDEAGDAVDWADGDVAVISTKRLLKQSSRFLSTPLSAVARTLDVPTVIVPEGYVFRDRRES